MGPLYKLGWFDFSYSLQLAVLIGFLFGFVLERAGFGSPRKLTAIFYLRDFAVIKVMFTAIVVCMLGLLYFSVFGWIDLARVYLLPTYIWPQLVGGLVLGVGFVMGGYCPTTSVVATVSGKLDGLVFIFGMTLGSIVFAWVFPLVEGLYSAGGMGAVKLGEVLGVNSGLIAFFVCLMAVGVYWFVEKVENRFGDPDT
ncbi:MAG: YeeE/YedE family protein, partial [Deltaproteobacteria bacterium]|nr:YeeE/YedE family protein [Deltaproteobacteria bacterium]